MAITKMDLIELLHNADSGDIDFLREGVRVLAQALMEVEVSAEIGAEHGERAPGRRVTQRNGYRPRDWDTRVGTIELAVPKLRTGSYFPSMLDARRRAEQALCAVVAQRYVEGVSTRRVDDIARQMGVESLSKSQVSRICGQLDSVVAAWRNRPLDAGPYAFMWVDALAIKVREAGRIVPTAVLVATAVNAAGYREILGVEVGAAEDGARLEEDLEQQPVGTAQQRDPPPHRRGRHLPQPRRHHQAGRRGARRAARRMADRTPLPRPRRAAPLPAQPSSTNKRRTPPNYCPRPHSRPREDDARSSPTPLDDA